LLGRCGGNARGDPSARVCKVSGAGIDLPRWGLTSRRWHPTGTRLAWAAAWPSWPRAAERPGSCCAPTTPACVVQGVPLHHLLEQSLGDDPDRWPEADVLHYATAQSAEQW